MGLKNEKADPGGNGDGNARSLEKRKTIISSGRAEYKYVSEAAEIFSLMLSRTWTAWRKEGGGDE